MATLGEGPRQATVNSRRRWPGPRGHWLFGCLRAIRREPLNFYRDAWRTYGDYVRIPTLPGYDVHLIADPAAVEHVLARNHKNYRKPSFLTGPIRLLIGDGLFSSEGDFWLRQRRLAQPAFLRSAIVRLAAPMTAAADRLIRDWSAAEERALDIVPEMMRLVLRIAGATLFGADLGAEVDAIGAAQPDVSAMVRHKMDNLFTAPLWFPTRLNRAFRRARALMDGVVLRVIGERRRRGAGAHDLLDLLLAARDEESGAGMTDRQLKDEVLTLLFAGHDTTADDLPHLPLATAVFEEALRLYPPAPGLARQALGPDEIQGYPVPAKAILMPSQWVTHRHPAYWDEPDRFRPERFLPGREADRPKFAYFPFGGGPRVCIGNTFALIEGALVLAALSQRFHLRPADEREVAIDPTFVLRPKGPVNLVVRKRS